MKHIFLRRMSLETKQLEISTKGAFLFICSALMVNILTQTLQKLKNNFLSGDPLYVVQEKVFSKTFCYL